MKRGLSRLGFVVLGLMVFGVFLIAFYSMVSEIAVALIPANPRSIIRWEVVALGALFSVLCVPLLSEIGRQFRET